MDLIAYLPLIAARIYRNVYKDRKVAPQGEGYRYNLANQLGYAGNKDLSTSSSTVLVTQK
jgi:citrate synthase